MAAITTLSAGVCLLPTRFHIKLGNSLKEKTKQTFCLLAECWPTSRSERSLQSSCRSPGSSAPSSSRFWLRRGFKIESFQKYFICSPSWGLGVQNIQPAFNWAGDILELKDNHQLIIFSHHSVIRSLCCSIEDDDDEEEKGPMRATAYTVSDTILSQVTTWNWETILSSLFSKSLFQVSGDSLSGSSPQPAPSAPQMSTLSRFFWRYLTLGTFPD